MLHEDYGHYSYTEHYSLVDIFIYTSADEEKGVLLELKAFSSTCFFSASHFDFVRLAMQISVKTSLDRKSVV